MSGVCGKHHNRRNEHFLELNQKLMSESDEHLRQDDRDVDPDDQDNRADAGEGSGDRDVESQKEFQDQDSGNTPTDTPDHAGKSASSDNPESHEEPSVDNRSMVENPGMAVGTDAQQEHGTKPSDESSHVAMESPYQGANMDSSIDRGTMFPSDDDRAAKLGVNNPVGTSARDAVMHDMVSQSNHMKRDSDISEQNAAASEADALNTTSVTDVTTTSVPKSGEGNIIITNTTHGSSDKPKEEEDPLVALRIAVTNLYQRARYKNLPVGEVGDLATPQAIYQSLNKLEYIVDGYRHSQLRSPNPDLNIQVDDGKSSGDDSSGQPDESSQSVQDETAPDDVSGEGFLQLHNDSNRVPGHRFSQVDDDDDSYGIDDDEVSNDADDYTMNDDEHEGEEDDAEEPDENGSAKKESRAEPEMDPKKALEILKTTITDLVETLNTVVASHTGVKNVLIKHTPNEVQVA
ncbi:uncharacterized protein BBOV_IV001100 [Babesia bovis T2Bo]|uniref:Uncharacterized protein n=1 Tax=Babesia bovis TaxID=5865 RepID=A7AV81_BABBO|nr:uncharacterized protein BBOV_IV001100 [Babesia bovis T2Bo]EDO05707.1 hypothetical protein BBOV_IV001100 [Babesia bovis T2Bo]BAN64384.1 hypothetical protein [Babesia bovis]|eukprot:XP_001609275.1 hypothetical protein [Babesia bovis T2Bo]